MAFLPHTDRDREIMLKEIGLQEIEDLFEAIPENVRFPDLELPPPVSEMEILRELQDYAEANCESNHFTYFLGAGAYVHFIPSAVDHIIRRSEFFTAYTPYQPEVSQGTLQAIFEYQSLIANLTGMDVSNASHYDGATALAEAVILALNHHRFKRGKILLSSGIHPHYREVVRTYMQGLKLEISGDEQAGSDLEKLVDNDTAMIAVQYPDFFGNIVDFTNLAATAKEAGALFCVVVNPISLGMLKPPSEFGADIVVGEGQPLGIPVSFGGPYLGFFATRDEYVRKMAGRLVGETVDQRGQRGYVLTLTPREQHIRRQKASSNICTNQGLMALAAAVYMSALGKSGMRKVAELCFHKAHYAATQIDKLAGYRLWNDGPFFHEFVIQCPQPISVINDMLLEKEIIGGYDLGKNYPELESHMLLAVTEAVSRPEIDRLVSSLKEVANA